MATDLRPPAGDSPPCPDRMRQARGPMRRARSSPAEAGARGAPRAAGGGGKDAAMTHAVARLLELTRIAFRIGAEDQPEGESR